MAPASISWSPESSALAAGDLDRINTVSIRVSPRSASFGQSPSTISSLPENQRKDLSIRGNFLNIRPRRRACGVRATSESLASVSGRSVGEWVSVLSG